MSSVVICVDVMGGDEGPEPVLRGIDAALAADEHLEVLAAGPERIVVPLADKRQRVRALVAEQAIAMDDDPISAVMKKRRSSIVLGCRALRRGDAQGLFSAGSTGAVTAAATAFVTPLRHERAGALRPVRPCITSALPNRAGGLTVFCDMGANPDVEPSDMVRFAQMGAAYARAVLDVRAPRVALLSNGTEDSKGSLFTKACFPLLRDQIEGFVGNCEGDGVVSGDYDVVVADGFAGNIALKAMEGSAKLLMNELKSTFLGSVRGRICGLVMRGSLNDLKKRLSGDSRGGAMLLGVRGVVLIGHGATSSEAVMNGTLSAASAVRAGLVESISTALDSGQADGEQCL
ncbi:phosphate:acyl-(acyl carrier protein) acyltransferase [Coriobacterium glomerans PW2]|uniref:Phosphate acyltransferase n=1 Tax=Coriobacterium glomerans (strain ATCC 49209 / DSM 20642 / JCM 10262 / PW2) TaxID=700015 RepID=F2N9Q9_CORGP|nr:phosphate acyltransferase PlsX [Coriobacterium glomerans]AEB07162.1 phosphate:acyl-(acyl carrier protein) acyltransferase [Coriobacterium glomerans PW2]